MAALAEITQEIRDAYQAWCETRPAPVRAVCERLPPWELYRMKRSGDRCTIVSYDEEMDGTVTLKVEITGQYNFTMFDRHVFGVSPDDLEPCEFPAEDELVGSMLTATEVYENLDAIRDIAGIKPKH